MSNPYVVELQQRLKKAEAVCEIAAHLHWIGNMDKQEPLAVENVYEGPVDGDHWLAFQQSNELWGALKDWTQLQNKSSK
jgi:hypothetical protein